jgi:CRP-like cAMP-binding protein
MPAMTDQGAAPTAEDRKRNDVLARLPDDEFHRLAELLTATDMQLRDVVFEPGDPIEVLYYPVDCIISIVAQTDGDAGIEVATVGNEGVAGLPAFLGAVSSPHLSFCQVEGRALHVGVVDLRRFLASDGALHRLMHLYTQSTMVQLAQNVACNRLHSTEQRAARWLLMTQDRVSREEFGLTQQFLAQMLGVRRATVSESASALQEKGFIRYRRGVISIRDRAGLERTTCECYHLVTREHDRLMSQ